MKTAIIKLIIQLLTDEKTRRNTAISLTGA